MDTRLDTEVFEEIKTAFEAASSSQLNKIEEFLKEEKKMYENRLSNINTLLKNVETARYESLKK